LYTERVVRFSGRPAAAKHEILSVIVADRRRTPEAARYPPGRVLFYTAEMSI
jgi:hypothetical protein